MLITLAILRLSLEIIINEQLYFVNQIDQVNAIHTSLQDLCKLNILFDYS